MQIKVDKEARALLTECCNVLLQTCGNGALDAVNKINNATDDKDLKPIKKKKPEDKNGK